jgi:WD40 repeat protein
MTSCSELVKRAARIRWFSKCLLCAAGLLVAALGFYAATTDRCVALKGHLGDVRALAYSPDGKVLASGGMDCSIKLWDWASGKELASLEPPEGRYVPDAPRGGVYDPVEGKTPPFIESFSFSADGKTLAVGASDRSIRLWDMAKEQQRLKIELDYSGPHKRGNTVFGVAMSPDGESVASASFDGAVRLWSATTGKLIRKVGSMSGIAYGVAFAPDGGLLASCGENGDVRVWDLKKEEVKYTWKRPVNYVNAVAVSPDGRYLAAAGDDRLDSDSAGEVVLWDLQTGKEVATPEGHKHRVCCVAFSPDGKLLASGGGALGLGCGEVIVWDVAKRERLTTLGGDSDLVLSVAFSPDGKHLATGSEDKTVRIWDLGSPPRR